VGHFLFISFIIIIIIIIIREFYSAPITLYKTMGAIRSL